MKNSLTDTEWIEHYMDRSLSTDNQQWIEDRLKNEPELQKKLAEYQLLIEGIRYSHLRDKLSQLRILEKTLAPVESKKKNHLILDWWKPLSVAATLFLLSTIYVINQPPKPEDLFIQFFQTYPNVFEPTVRGVETLDKRREAFTAYDHGDFKTASILFAELLKEKKEPGILLLLGNANLSLGHNREAQNNFLALINDFDDLDVQAKWYLGLTYLKQRDEKKAKVIFKELANSQSTYSKKAKELLENVK